MPKYIDKCECLNHLRSRDDPIASGTRSKSNPRTFPVREPRQSDSNASLESYKSFVSKLLGDETSSQTKGKRKRKGKGKKSTNLKSKAERSSSRTMTEEHHTYVWKDNQRQKSRVVPAEPWNRQETQRIIDEIDGKKIFTLRPRGRAEPDALDLSDPLSSNFWRRELVQDLRARPADGRNPVANLNDPELDRDQKINRKVKVIKHRLDKRAKKIEKRRGREHQPQKRKPLVRKTKHSNRYLPKRRNRLSRSGKTKPQNALLIHRQKIHRNALARSKNKRTRNTHLKNQQIISQNIIEYNKETKPQNTLLLNRQTKRQNILAHYRKRNSQIAIARRRRTKQRNKCTYSGTIKPRNRYMPLKRPRIKTKHQKVYKARRVSTRPTKPKTGNNKKGKSKMVQTQNRKRKITIK